MRNGVCDAGFQATGDAGHRCTRLGKPIDSTTRLLISGCARKLAPQLGRDGLVDRNLQALLSRAEGSGALIYADGPHEDETYQTLRHLVARDSRVRAVLAVSEPPDRLSRIALCRNVLLGEALAKLPDDGLLVTLDLDCQPAADSISSVMSQLHAGSSWDLLTANSVPYRDSFALRSPRLGIDYDCWQDQQVMAFRGSCLRYRISIDPAAAVIPVRSAFNGASVLRIGSMRARNASGCRYRAARTLSTADGVSNGTLAALPGAKKARGAAREQAVCEHVPFNLCLWEHGVRIGIAPSLLTDCPCGAICGDLQRYFYRVRILANGSLVVRDHRKRHPFGAAEWAKFVAPMCAAGPGPLSLSARGPAEPVSALAAASAAAPPESSSTMTVVTGGRRLGVPASSTKAMKERVAPPSAPTTMC